MKKLLYIMLAGLFFACTKEEAGPATPSDLSNLTGEPRVGGVLLKWNKPADSNFLYVEVRYQRNDETRTVKVSRFTDSVLIDGLLNKYEYSFEVQAFNATSGSHAGGKVLAVGPIRPVRRPVAVAYLQDQLIKLTVTDPMIETYTQETSEGHKQNLIDGDRLTYWHTAWSANVAPLPHWVKISFAEAAKLGAIKYYFRNNNTQSGRPTQFSVETSEDGLTWTKQWTSQAGLSVTTPVTEERLLAFDKNYSARFFRINIEASFNNTTWIALGDMSFHTMGEKVTDLETVAEDNY